MTTTTDDWEAHRRFIRTQILDQAMRTRLLVKAKPGSRLAQQHLARLDDLLTEYAIHMAIPKEKFNQGQRTLPDLNQG